MRPLCVLAGGRSAVPRDYSDLSKEQLIALLQRRDRERRLGLVWEREAIEKDRAVNHDFVTLDEDGELARPGPNGARNLVIEGDNYDALRALRMTHAGKVKCIYIDPPYNTGAKDWVYNDHYVAKEDRYRHSLWLEFMHQRLTLARDLLREDGVLLVSIDDGEYARLRELLDLIMPDQFVGTVVWRRRSGAAPSVDYFFATNHEYVLVCANPGFLFRGAEKTWQGYANPDDDPRGDWASDNLTLGFDRLQRKNLFYPLHDPDRDIWYPCNPNYVWRFASVERLGEGTKVRTKPIEDFIAEKKVLFPDGRVEVFETRDDLLAAIDAGDVPTDPRGNPLIWRDMPDLDFWVGKRIGWGTPRFKRHKKDLKNQFMPLSSWFTARSDVKGKEATDEDGAPVVGDSAEGTRALRALFDEAPFAYPKPPSLMKTLLVQCTEPNDLILDFFAGSGTTAHAAMALDAEEGVAPEEGRRWIMVSSTEATAEEPEKNLARDVLRERIVRAAAKLGRAPDFAYLRCRRVAPEDIAYEVEGPDVWRLIQLRHDLPLASYDPDAAVQQAAGAQRVLYLDAVNEETAGAVEAAIAQEAGARAVHVYSWTAGLLRERFEGRASLQQLPGALEAGFWT